MRKQKASGTRFLSIFGGFGRHLGPPKRSQDAPKSMLKRHQNLISFWRPLGTSFFRPKRRQEREHLQNLRAARRNAQPPGEDLGGGRQNLREEESGKKNPETSAQPSSTPTPLGGGSLRAFRRAYLSGCFNCIPLVSINVYMYVRKSY